MINPNDLNEEIAQRRYAEEWQGKTVMLPSGALLNPCPICHANADAVKRGDGMFITCSRWGCRAVEAKTEADAVKMWNEPTFRQRK